MFYVRSGNGIVPGAFIFLQAAPWAAGAAAWGMETTAPACSRQNFRPFRPLAAS